ncbi:MAG: branched-chain amino acid ABC transporter permease [Chloroflexi bacterium]|nr:branched-chain amino acid ABC transporter permease [Chloroflexota bacterium]
MRSSKVDWKKLATYGVLLALMLTIPLFVKNLYVLHILMVAGIWIILTVSLHLLFTTGVLSLAHAAFMGIGAYCSAILTMKLGWSFWIALPMSGIISAAIAALAGSIFLRVKGLLFAVITFAFGEAVRLVFSNWPGLGGDAGLTRIPAPDPISFPFDVTVTFVGKMPYYYLVLIIVAVSVLILYRIEKSRLGMVFTYIEENDALAESAGINVQGYRLLSFGIACFFAGIGGSLYGHYHSYLAPDEFGVWTSALIFLLCVIGGPSSIMGPVVGAFVLTIIPELLRGAKAYAPLFYAVVILLIVFVLPEGLVSLPKRLRKWAQKSRKSLESR